MQAGMSEVSILRIVTIFIAGMLLSGCNFGTEYTGSYVGGDETAVILLSLVEGDDYRINATMSVSEPDYAAGKLKAKTVGLTGIRDGDSINLFSSNGSGGSMTLTANEGKLVWQIPTSGEPMEFVETDQAGYQERLSKLSDGLNGNDVGLLPDEL